MCRAHPHLGREVIKGQAGAARIDQRQRAGDDGVMIGGAGIIGHGGLLLAKNTGRGGVVRPETCAIACGGGGALA